MPIEKTLSVGYVLFVIVAPPVSVSSLVFKYTVGGSDNNSTDLSVSSYSGTILDEAGNAAGAVSGDLGNVIIDVTPPVITGISINNGSGGTNNDSVTVTFDESVYPDANQGTADLQASDFAVTLSGGTASAPVISSVSNHVNPIGII